MRLKIGDTVLITAGKDKGRTGKIDKLSKKENKVVVSGVNIYKRARKAGPNGEAGGLIEFSRPLPLANIALVCPHCKKQTRIGLQILKNGSGRLGAGKVRICKKCKRQIDTKGAKL
ncbi:MAG: 50S ribosomal protein L24 [Patescibacteria group bacterium]